MKRRTPFDAERSKRAKRKGKARARTIEFWYRAKYNLTGNDPRFLNTTIEEMETDYWAHHYFGRPNEDEVEDEDFDLGEVLRRLEQNPDDWEDIN